MNARGRSQAFRCPPKRGSSTEGEGQAVIDKLDNAPPVARAHEELTEELDWHRTGRIDGGLVDLYERALACPLRYHSAALSHASSWAGCT